MVRFSPSIDQRKQAYNCEVNDVGAVYNKRMNCFGIYRPLLTSR